MIRLKHEWWHFRSESSPCLHVYISKMATCSEILRCHVMGEDVRTSGYEEMHVENSTAARIHLANRCCILSASRLSLREQMLQAHLIVPGSALHCLHVL
jgi:hypothetical protein